MSSTQTRRPEARRAGSPRSGAGLLGAAAALAAASAFWAAFQWRELLVARRGGEPFCGFGEGDVCTAVWDSAFANAVQHATGLPVAGWGLVWSLVALALPVWALVRRASERAPGALGPALLLTALAGAVGVALLASASLAEGQLCPTCALTYLLVLAYAAICWMGRRTLRGAALRRGAALALGTAAAAFLALLYPGLNTPHARKDAAFDPRALAGGGDLAALVATLPPDARQELSDALAAFAHSEARALRPARALIGAPDAPLRVTEFADVLCGHCAELHHALAQLVEAAPAGSLALEPRQFPLDGECNAALHAPGERPVRCLSARALICMEGRPGAFEFAGRLFDSQHVLTQELVLELAEPFLSREELATCVSAPETEAKLRDDIAWALEYDIRGTPMVLLNGRKAPRSGVFLYAMTLAGGDPEHPVFEDLPPPTPGAPAP